MAKFYLHMDQRGGCDYTIACGQKLVELGASTMDEAVEAAIVIMREHGQLGGEEADDGYWLNLAESERIHEVKILEVSSVVDLPLKQWEDDARSRFVAAQDQEKEDKERSEYERLKAKYAQDDT